jgi:isoleucyl-tRNA synthetase
MGNVISPEDILKSYGADILRVWASASDYAEDLRIDKNILIQHAESYRKIRNTFRFMLGNLKDNFEKQNFEKIKLDEFDELEQFILHKLFSIKQSFDENLKNYNFHKMYKDLLNFCTLDLSSFYFDIRKDVLYCDSINSKKRKNCIIVLNIILESLLKWFAPILVFTTEEIYSLVNKNNSESIHENNFVKIPAKWKNEKLNEKWSNLFRIKQEANIAIEEKRANKEIGSSLEAEIKLILKKDKFELLDKLDLADYFIVSKAEKELSKNDDIKIEVKKAQGQKCERCWKILEKKCERESCPIK